MGKHAFTVVVAVVIAASLLIYLFTYQVRSSEVAVVLTFGKPELKSPEAGYHFQWPWPIQEVRRFDNRLHVGETRLEETLTRDRLTTIITSVCVGWRIGAGPEDLARFNVNFGRGKSPEEILAAAWLAIEKTIRSKTLQVFGQHELTEFVAVNSGDLKYDVIEDEIQKIAREEGLRIYGIDVALVKIKRLELPEKVKDQIIAQMATERNREVENTRAAGTEVATGIKALAESQSKQIVSMAQSEATRIRAEGDAEAAKVASVLAEDPELATYLLKVRTLRTIPVKNTTIVLDGTTPPWDLLVQPAPTPNENIKSVTGAPAIMEPPVAAK